MKDEHAPDVDVDQIAEDDDEEIDGEERRPRRLRKRIRRKPRTYMDRRSFLKLSPALPVGAVTASLVLREDGREPVTLDVSVLKTQPGDVLVLSTPNPISEEAARRIKAHVEHVWPELKAMVMGDGLKLDGVIRTTIP